MIEDLMTCITAQVESDIQLTMVNVTKVATEFMARKFDEDCHEMLQYFGLAPDLRWWKP